jgi:hypothetical protein
MDSVISAVLVDCANESFKCRRDHFGGDGRRAISHNDASVETSLIPSASQRIVAQRLVTQLRPLRLRTHSPYDRQYPAALNGSVFLTSRTASFKPGAAEYLGENCIT